jgi:hypothetical protein
MSTAVAIALIALLGSVGSALLTVFGAPMFQARREERKALETYREPLLAAAYELQARLHNILTNDFMKNYVLEDSGGKQEAALDSTLYVFAQFFGWSEIIRREVQFLRFASDTQTREISGLLLRVGETFLTEDYGPQCMIWRVEQRGLGERMISPAGTRATCIGYASFVEQRGTMSRWLDPLEQDLKQLEDGGRRRLTELQHLLLELVQRLDPDRARYPFELTKA